LCILFVFFQFQYIKLNYHSAKQKMILASESSLGTKDSKAKETIPSQKVTFIRDHCTLKCMTGQSHLATE